MANDPLPFGTTPGSGFNHLVSDRDRVSDASLPPPKPPGPWSANLPMNQERAERMRAALAKHGDGETLRQFDNELKDAGYQPPPDPSIAKDMKASGLHQTKSSDHNPEIPRTFDDESASRIRSELTAFAAELKMQPGLANHLIETLSVIGPAFQRMSPSERETWQEKETKTLTTLSGGPDRVAAVRELAQKALKRVSGDFAKKLAGSGVLNSAFLTLTLANQQRYFEEFDRRRRK
jgi:hypothetical protein